MFELEYDFRQYKVEFKTGNPLRYYHPGKTYPKTTQCIITRQGLVIGIGEVVKHHIDVDNPEYAMRAAMKKALMTETGRLKLWKELRTALWAELEEFYKLRNKNLKNE